MPPESVRDELWEAYEAAERRYRNALAARASHEALATAAEQVCEAADKLETVAWRDAIAAGEDGADAAHNLELEAEKAELLHELWADMAAAYRGRLSANKRHES
jgi:hypothetical protein